MNEKTSKKEEKPVEAIAVSIEKAENPVEENPVEENPVDEKDSILKKSFDAFIAKKAELETKGIYGDEALKELQPFFNKMGEVTKEEVQSKDSISVDAIKKALREVMPELFPQFAKYLGSNNQPIKVDKESGIPSPRSINVERALIPEDGKQELSQIQKLARKGLLE